MSGQIDPFFANHPQFVEERRQRDEFFAKLREEIAANEHEERLRAAGEAICEEIKGLEGEALDKRLRELGFDPDELLASFNRAMGI